VIVHSATPHRVTGERIGLGLLVGAAAMVPWIYVLSGSLPDTTRVSGWSTAWVGLDVMELFGLLGTGLLLLRRDPRGSLVAAVTAALLLVDAWFDVTTSSSGRALAIAIAMALLVELPLCALCALIAAGVLAPLRSTSTSDPSKTTASSAATLASPLMTSLASGATRRRSRFSTSSTANQTRSAVRVAVARSFDFHGAGRGWCASIACHPVTFQPGVPVGR
jgi:hypothetical protein